MNAMIRKELRDASRWSLIALVPYSVSLFASLSNFSFYHDLSNNLLGISLMVSAMFALLLGLATFLPDERESARAFLVHRGISPSKIFWTRVAVGMTVYFATMIIPLGVAALYLLIMGPQYAPVSPLQVLPALIAVVLASAFYFGGIIVACRPCSWFGTRLLPLLSALAIALTSTAGLAVFIEQAGPFLVLSAGVVGLFTIVFASQHAFLRLPTNTPPTSRTSNSPALFFMLFVASILSVTCLAIPPLTMLSNIPKVIHGIHFSKSGIPFIATQLYQMAGYRDMVPMADSSIGPPTLDPKEIDWNGQITLMGTGRLPASWDAQTFVLFPNKRVYYDSFGYLLVYAVGVDNRLSLLQVIGSDRVSLPNEPRGTPFQSEPRLHGESRRYVSDNHIGNTLLRASASVSDMPRLSIYDSHGVYLVDLENRKIETVLRRELSGIGEIAEKEGNDRLLVMSKNDFTLYRKRSSQELKGGNLKEAAFEFDKEGMFSVPENPHFGNLFFQDLANWTYVMPIHREHYIYTRFKVTRSIDSKIESYEFEMPREIVESLVWRSPWEIPILLSALPSIVTIPFVVSPWSSWYQESAITNGHIALLLLSMLLATILSFSAAWFRGLSKGRLLGWSIAGSLFGFGTSLAIIAIYPRVISIPCPQCNRRRRVERERCDHCGAGWEPRVTEGIEVLDDLAAPVSTAESVGV